MAIDLEEGERRTLHGLQAAVGVIRKEDKEMPAQTLAVLLEVVNNPGITMKDLETKMELSTAATSRIISRLSQWEKHEVPGHNFVEARKNPLDRRYMVVEPTAKGMAFVRRLVEAAHRGAR